MGKRYESKQHKKITNLREILEKKVVKKTQSKVINPPMIQVKI